MMRIADAQAVKVMSYVIAILSIYLATQSDAESEGLVKGTKRTPS